jgi:multidrug resistance efflux pump
LHLTIRRPGARVALAASVLLLVGGCQTGGAGNLAEWITVRAADTSAPDGLAEPLMASGTIEARQVRVASEVGGRLLEVRAAAGAAVQEGVVLVVLDATPLLLQLSLAEAAVETARADLAVVQAGPQAEVLAAAQAALALAQAQRDGSLRAWENAQREIDNPQALDAQIAQTRTQVALAEQAVELAEAQLAREKLLRDQKSGRERQAADLQVQAAEEALAAAQAEQQAAQTLLNWLWIIRREPLGLIARAHLAEGQYRIAEAGVQVAQARLDDLRAGPTVQEVSVARAALAQKEAEANALRVQVELLTLTSPLDGVVVSQAMQPGELAAPAATILSLADLSETTLVVYVPENRIGQVRLGQSAGVTVDSFPGRSFEGRVIRIGDQPEYTPRNVTTVEQRLNTFYAVVIRLPNPDGLLKMGMPADARF